MGKTLLRVLALLPLRCVHAVGVIIGWTVYLASPVYAARLRDNLRQSGLHAGPEGYKRLLRQAIAETGKGAAELFLVWFKSAAKASRLVVAVDHWHLVEQARSRGKGIIFLTPHLGCFEVSALYAAQRVPITILYRPPKLTWLEPLMVAGRKRGQASLARTDLRGVRALFRALKRGEAIGVLPDQAPGAGEGIWVDFFGRPAYTMTLVGRLQQASGATVILAFAQRLPRGRGYRLQLRPLEADLSGESGARLLNRAIEALIAECPSQYLWSYNRYKVPAGAEPPKAHASGAAAGGDR